MNENEPETSEQLVTYSILEVLRPPDQVDDHYVPPHLEVTCAHQCHDSPTYRSNDSDIEYSSPQNCPIRGITRRLKRTRTMCTISLSGYTASESTNEAMSWSNRRKSNETPQPCNDQSVQMRCY